MKNKALSCILMHFIFVLYSFYTVLGKKASGFDFLSVNFCFLYCAMIFILFVYAVLWQQVLKSIPLSIASANKAVTIFWGMWWGFLFFNEEISIKKIAGAFIIITGILILSFSDQINSFIGKKSHKENHE